MTGARTVPLARPVRALATDGTPWQLLSACRDDPEVMFPSNERNKTAVNAARAICFACPVRAQCLAAALAEEDGSSLDDRWGIRGGLTSSERLQRQGRRSKKKGEGGRPLAECGTRSAYQRHLRNGEPIDETCLAAQANRPRAGRKKAAA